MAQTNVQAFSGDVEISGETVLGTATYRKKIGWNRNALAYVYLGNIRTNNTTGIRLDVSLNSSNSGYEMYQFQITLNGNDESHAGGKMICSVQGGNVGNVHKEVDIGYVYVGSGGSYEYQLWLKDPTSDNTGAMDAYLNCQGYYNFDTGVSDVAQGGAAPTNFNLSTVGVLVDRLGNVGIGTANPATPFHINKLTATTNPKAHTTTEFIRIRGDKVIGQTYAISGGIKLGGETGGTATADGRMEFYVNDGAGVSNEYGDIPDKLVMCMRGDGNVGIGTTSPEHNLHVRGSGGVRVAVESTSGYAGLELGGYSGGLIDFKTPFSDDYDARIIYSGDNLLFTGTNVLIPENLFAEGNVGIGTNASPSQLTVVSTINALDATDSATFDKYTVVITNTMASGANDKEMGISFASFTGTTFPTTARTPGAAITHERVDEWSKGKLHFKTKGSATFDGACTTRMTIDESGNVGIGKTDPGSKLDVNGTFRGSTVLVGTGGEVGLTLNDGGGNANLTFNHAYRTPDQDGSSARITSGVDGNTGDLTFSVKDNVTAGTVIGTVNTMRMRETYVQAFADFYVDGNVGIGTDNPAETLHIQGQTRFTGNMYGYDYPEIQFYRGTETSRIAGYLTPGYNSMQIRGAGGGGYDASMKFGQTGQATQIYASTTITEGSDDRIKYREEERVCTEQLYEDFKRLKVYRYEKFLGSADNYESNVWIPTDEEWEVVRLDEDTPKTEETGVVAQELLALQSFAEDVGGSEYDENGKQNIYGVAYHHIFLKTIPVVQRLIQEIETLKIRVETLENV